MKRYSVEEVEDPNGSLVRHSDLRRLARELDKLADDVHTMEWIDIQDKLHMIAKSILGEH